MNILLNSSYLNSKFELTGETKNINCITVYRIKAKNGTKGGLIESENNLSESGECFVCEDAIVMGNSQVEDDADVYGNAKLFNNVHVTGNSEVTGKVTIDGNITIGKNVFISSSLRGELTITGTGSITSSDELNDKRNEIKRSNATISGYIAISKGIRIVGDGYICTVKEEYETVRTAELFRKKRKWYNEMKEETKQESLRYRKDLFN